MKKISLLLIGMTGLIGTPAAFAADSTDSGFYVLGGVGQTIGNDDKSTIDNALASVGGAGFSSTLSRPTVYKLQAGYQATKYLAVEGGYLGSNNETYTASGGNLGGPVTASASVSGWNFNVVGILPVANQFSLLGKVGLAAIRESGTVTGPGGSASLSGNKTDTAFGIGAKYDFANAVFVRIDLDRYNVGSNSSSSRVNVWMLDLGYKFY